MNQDEYNRMKAEGMRRLAKDIDYLWSVVEVEDAGQALAVLPYIIRILEARGNEPDSVVPNEGNGEIV